MRWTTIWAHSRIPVIHAAFFLGVLVSYCTADDKIALPILWVGIEGAPSMEDPGVVNEDSTDDVLWT